MHYKYIFLIINNNVFKCHLQMSILLSCQLIAAHHFLLSGVFNLYVMWETYQLYV